MRGRGAHEEAEDDNGQADEDGEGERGARDLGDPRVGRVEPEVLEVVRPQRARQSEGREAAKAAGDFGRVRGDVHGWLLHRAVTMHGALRRLCAIRVVT